jgi:hypothetical protein
MERALMSIFNPFAIGFACVAATFVVGADYVVQSKANGSYPGEYAFTSYLENYGLRVDETIAGIDKVRRQSEEARVHLPEAPQGWERVEWDIAAIDMDAVTAGMDLVSAMAAKEERRKSLKMANYHAWEYRAGTETIRISARFQDDYEKPATAMAGWLTGTFHPISKPRYGSYALIGGVPFLKVDDSKRPEAVSHLLLEAYLGEQIVLAIAADARPETVNALLSKIDFDNLNMMLDQPLAGIGTDAPALDPSQQGAIVAMYADAMNSGHTVTMVMNNGVMNGKTSDEVDAEAMAALAAEQAAAEAAAQAAAVERIKVNQSSQTLGTTSNRIQLSGGRTCLSGSGRLCNN